MSRYLILVNPVSGRGGAPRMAERLERHLLSAGDVRVVRTKGPGDAGELAEGAVDEVDRIVVIGGDGTLNETVTGLLRTGRSADDLPELGFLPGGTGNAARRAFGMTRNPAAWPSSIDSWESCPVDVGMARLASGVERPFLLWLGAGVDAVVMDSLHRARKGFFMGPLGLLRNLPVAARALVDYPMPPIEARWDGGPPMTLSNALVANVGTIPFVGHVSNRADAHDGVLNLVAVRPRGGWTLLGLTARMLVSRLTGSEGVLDADVRAVELRSEGDVPVQLDGESVGRLPVSVEVRPGALRLLGRRPRT